MTALQETVVFADEARGRTLDTLVLLPHARPAPLVVFAHGYVGHPRKFSRLFRTWHEAGFAVVAPRLPRTADDAKPEPTFDDAPNQPGDLSFVLSAVLDRHPGAFDAGAICFAGFSLGAVTVLAAAYEERRRDPRVRSVIAIAGGVVIDGDYDISGPPLLLINMRHDPLVAYRLGRDAFDRARTEATLVTVESASHHLGVEDEPLPAVSEVVDTATLAFLDLTLRDDTSARGRLVAVGSLPGAVVERKLDPAQPAP